MNMGQRWQKVIGFLWGKRKVEPYAAEPSQAQLQEADLILKFKGSSVWPAYEEHLCVLLGETMEASFSAVKVGNVNGAMVHIARARAIYELLTEPQSAAAMIKKSQTVIIRPTTTRSNPE